MNGPASDCKVNTERLPSWVPVDRTIAMCNLKVSNMIVFTDLFYPFEKRPFKEMMIGFDMPCDSETV